MKDNEYTMEMFGIVMQHLMLLSISGQLIMDAEVISIVNDCSKNTPYAALLIIKQPINLCSSQEALLILIFESLFCIMQCISVAFIKHLTSSENKCCSLLASDLIPDSNGVYYMYYYKSLCSILCPLTLLCLACQY